MRTEVGLKKHTDPMPRPIGLKSTSHKDIHALAKKKLYDERGVALGLITRRNHPLRSGLKLISNSQRVHCLQRDLQDIFTLDYHLEAASFVYIKLRCQFAAFLGELQV